MVVVTVTVRKGGLHPLQACKAWYMVEEEGCSLAAVAEHVRTVDGKAPKEHALRNAIQGSQQIERDLFDCGTAASAADAGAAAARKLP